MGKRGRPTRSTIRQNLIDILQFMGEAYGYQMYKAYKDIYAPVTLRVIYYHLMKGKSLGEFEVAGVKKTQGSYSWGPEAERIFYKLGPNAKPKAPPEVKTYFEKKLAA